MINKIKNKEGGFIELIIVIIVVLLLLRYLNVQISITDTVNWFLNLFHSVFK